MCDKVCLAGKQIDLNNYMLLERSIEIEPLYQTLVWSKVHEGKPDVIKWPVALFVILI